MTYHQLCNLFGIRYPIIQGGMVWVSGYKLAAAVSNAGGLGLIGAGSMHPEVFREHIKKCKQATSGPFGVNIPLLYPETDRLIEMILELQVPIVFTSAGNPKLYTATLKAAGITVVHVVSSKKFALKAQEAGVDAVVAEGFEAGGHNGREETTTMVLIPEVVNALEIPVIAAGGIGSGRAMAAAFALGASGVQVGTRFAVTEESSAHIDFKQACIRAEEGETALTLKQVTPVRLLKNLFCNDIMALEQQGADVETLRKVLGKGRAKKGIFEGDLVQGELEIGQVVSAVKEIKPAGMVVAEMMNEFNDALKNLRNISDSLK